MHTFLVLVRTECFLYNSNHAVPLSVGLDALKNCIFCKIVIKLLFVNVGSGVINNCTICIILTD